MGSTYRRRAAGRGVSRKSAGGLSVRERVRLFQLGASVLLFLLVFLGRGVLPGQVAAWKAILSADMDFQGALSTFGQTISAGGSVLEALDVFWAGLTGNAPSHVQPEPEQGGAQDLPLPQLPSYEARLGRVGAIPERSIELTALPYQPEDPAGEESPAQEPVVTAMAQQYSDSGEELPDRVSLQYYNLGLEETAVPVMGSVTSAFGFRNHPVDGVYSFHTALDIGVPNGTDVLAFADGTVRYIGENSIYGLYVMLDHDNGVSTFYAHCEKLLVSKGEEVRCGQTIAKSGETGNATGPHLHFSIEKDGIRLDPAYYVELS